MKLENLPTIQEQKLRKSQIFWLKSKKMVDEAYEGTVSTQKEFENIVKRSSEVKAMELEIKDAIAEQNNGGKLILDAVSKLKDSEHSVTAASKQLLETENRVRDAIKSLAM